MMSKYDQGADTHDHDEWSEPPKWPKVVGIVSIVWGVLWGSCATVWALPARSSRPR